jgi:AraC family transcriptional regulator
MERAPSTILYGGDARWNSVSTLVYQTPELVEASISHAILDAGQEVTFQPCTVDEKCTVVLHLNAVDIFELRGRSHLLWSGRRAPGSVNVIAEHEALTLRASHRLEALVLGIPYLSIPRVAAQRRTPRGADCNDAHDAYDAVAHRLGLALIPAFHIAANRRSRAAVHLARAMCYHFAFKYAGSTNAAQSGLAPWQARTAEKLLEQGALQVRDVATACRLSPSHFSRAFRITFERSPHAWIAERRIAALKRLLLDADVSLADAAVQMGFSDQTSMSRSFRRIVGASPGAWRLSQREGPV